MKIIKRIVTGISVICMVLLLCLPVHVKANESKVLKKKVIYVNQSIQLEKVKNVSKKQIKWSSDNKNIVKITVSGKVTGVKKGKAIVKAVYKKTKKTLVSYRIIVKNFKEKEIKSKVSVVTDTSLKPLEMVNKKYCVINSKKELEEFKKDICTQYVKAGYGTKSECKKSAFYKKLSGYKKSFFQNKTLCIIENMLPYSGQKTEVGKFIKKQNKKGKVYGQLDVTYVAPEKDKVATTVIAYQEYFIELSKSDAEYLQNYKISVTKEK